MTTAWCRPRFCYLAQLLLSNFCYTRLFVLRPAVPAAALDHFLRRSYSTTGPVPPHTSISAARCPVYAQPWWTIFATPDPFCCTAMPRCQSTPKPFQLQPSLRHLDCSCHALLCLVLVACTNSAARLRAPLHPTAQNIQWQPSSGTNGPWRFAGEQSPNKTKKPCATSSTQAAHWTPRIEQRRESRAKYNARKRAELHRRRAAAKAAARTEEAASQVLDEGLPDRQPSEAALSAVHMDHPSMAHALGVLHTALTLLTGSVKGKGFTVAEIGRWHGVAKILASSWLELHILQSSSDGSVEGLLSTGHLRSSSSKRGSKAGLVEGAPSPRHLHSSSRRIVASVEGVPLTERRCGVQPCKHIWRDPKDPQLGAVLTLALKHVSSSEERWGCLMDRLRERFYKFDPKAMAEHEVAVLRTLNFKGPRTLATLIPI